MQRNPRKFWRAVVGIVSIGLAATALSGCSSAGNGDSKTFTIWQYEATSSAQYKGWQEAVTIFKKKHPDVNVKFVTTSFANIQKNGKLLLSGNKAPDVLEVNKGGADAGQLASQGLLENLNDEVKKYGWDKDIKGSVASLAKYDADGNAGSGNWYGIPNIGEFIVWFYNKDMFAKAGITEPPTTRAELEADMQKFTEQGTTPVASSANGFGALWTWYSLVSAGATRDQIDNYMFLKGSPDVDKAPWSTGAEEFQDWIDKGYLGTRLASVTGDQMDQAWLSQKNPLLLEDSNAFTNIKASAKFDWGTFALPDANLNVGSSGHLWAVPTKSSNKELAYDWINTTLSPEVQNVMGKNAGLPLAGDPSVISDPQVKALSEQFQTLVDGDKLSYFPDYPLPGLLDFQQSGMQALTNKSTTADAFSMSFQQYYTKGKSQLQ